MSNLFSPVQIGSLLLPNRFVMAPMTRSRATPAGIQTSLAAEYYAQRADGGLLITEAIAVSKQGSGYPMIPGLWNDEQGASWSPVVKQVHEGGGRIFAQLFHTGRIAHPDLAGEEPVSASTLAPGNEGMTASFENTAYPTPRALTEEEIPGVVAAFALAAKRAVDLGFDGVEIHAANGYLIDQFLRTGSNQRMDGYGGSVEARVRFLHEILSAVTEAIGAERTGVRFSPFNPFNGMSDANPEETFSAAVAVAKEVGVAFVHLIDGSTPEDQAVTRRLKDHFGGAVIVNGGYDKARAEAAIEEGFAAVAFGVPYLANPDLVERFRAGADLNAPDFATFYGGGAEGYTDYPTLALAN